MQLCRFEILNIKCIENAYVEWEELIVRIGESNVGRLSVLLAIVVILNGSSIKDASLLRRHQIDEANAIGLIGHFDGLTDDERNQAAAHGHMDGGRWVEKLHNQGQLLAELLQAVYMLYFALIVEPRTALV
ncbi:hypothetical protein L1889_15970 [Paenalcaligenes niemegkensis]|uniref:hypothetical protein n=1 Tax=Paenalcaligenes niemegkensis TaxID=2895469 RepID=UPI001EE869D8|nr:hypothetical protein [Paenalcaligenes niemegkensis]MCQ9617981.1 hypothetical protein [Paenalcaligenes niemegkensis]